MIRSRRRSGPVAPQSPFWQFSSDVMPSSLNQSGFVSALRSRRLLSINEIIRIISKRIFKTKRRGRGVLDRH
jgi:hypothetical protein